MNRIIFIVILSLYAGILKAQQNTILIIADDLSPDYLGFYEDAKDTANTPNLRHLQEQGIRFTKVWSYPFCSIARASIFTGKYPFRTGVGYVINRNNNAPELDTSETGISKLLKYKAPVKYNTACIGKWHLQRANAANLLFPNVMGYDLYSGNFNGQIPDYYSYQRIKNGVIDTVTTYATTQTVNDALAWMDTMPATKPFFLWLAFNAPHYPFHLPPASLITNTGLSGTQTDIDAHPKLYFKAMVEAMDSEIGRLFNYLDTHNLMDSTNIIFIGDNGNDERTAQLTVNNAAKGTLYNYGVRVPLIIKGPAVVNPNRISNALVSTTDLFATIAELSNFYAWADSIPLNKRPVDSRSLMPILKNQSPSIRNWNFSEMFLTGSSNIYLGKSICNSNFHLIRYDSGSEALFNTAKDTFETNNLLNGNLNTLEMNNYYSLCDTLSHLISSVSYCSKPSCSVSVKISTSHTKICSGTFVNFSQNHVNGGNAPAYTWFVNGVAVSSSSNYSSDSITSGDSIWCEMVSNDSCALYYKATSNIIVMTVSASVPGQPKPISGPAKNLCDSLLNYVYSIKAVNNATSYTWIVPAQAVIISGQGSKSISVNYSSLFTQGVISVSAKNVCGSSTPSSLIVSAKPYAPGPISGTATVCSNQQNVPYSVPAVIGTVSYKWTVPFGAAIMNGQNTNAIDVNYGQTGGSVSVFVKNNCASSSKSVKTISIFCPEVQPGDNMPEENSFHVINPFSDRLNLTSNNDFHNTQLTLTDFTGRKVLFCRHVNLKKDVPFSKPIDKVLPSGIYLLNVITEKQDFEIKLIHH